MSFSTATPDFVTYAAWRTCQAYISSMDVFTQRRIVTLRHEIASLQHNNEVYRLQRHHTQLEVDTNEVRRFRLLAIREELHNMTVRPGGKPMKLIEVTKAFATEEQ